MTGLAVVAALAAMLVQQPRVPAGALGSRRTGARPSRSGGSRVTSSGWRATGWAGCSRCWRSACCRSSRSQAVLAGTVPVTAVAGAGGDPRRLSRPQPGRRRARGDRAGPGRGLCSAGPGGTAAPGGHARTADDGAPGRPGCTFSRRSRSPGCWPRSRGSPSAACRCRCARCTSRRRCGSRCGDLLTEPVAYAVLVFGVTGTVVLAGAMRRAAVGSLVAVLSVTEVVVPGLVGLVLLGDRVRPGWAWRSAPAGHSRWAGWFCYAIAGAGVGGSVLSGRGLRPAGSRRSPARSAPASSTSAASRPSGSTAACGPGVPVAAMRCP